LSRDIVCLRNISVNTLHKGDDDDDISACPILAEEQYLK
jgi:hypothetical protein